jgi:general stress protein 26
MESRRERLERSKNYWICTARPDGRPHAIPVWGFFLDDTVYFGTARSSQKARNLAHNPTVSVHLESGDDVVIVEGAAREVPLSDRETIAKLDAASKTKYKMPLMIVAESVFMRCVQEWS